jgi:putative ABC transport system substrate-binding protein
MAHLGRREFIGVLGGVAAWPLASRAQQGERMRRIGALLPFTADDAEGRAIVAALQRGLQELGFRRRSIALA